MNPTEDRPEDIAGNLFDQVIVPLAKSRKAAGRQPYFPLAGERGVKSYFEEPEVRAMGPADFEFPGGGTATGLVDALAGTWQREGEAGLVELAPGLKQLAETLSVDSDEGDGSVDIKCYTIF